MGPNALSNLDLLKSKRHIHWNRHTVLTSRLQRHIYSKGFGVCTNNQNLRSHNFQVLCCACISGYIPQMSNFQCEMALLYCNIFHFERMGSQGYQTKLHTMYPWDNMYGCEQFLALALEMGLALEMALALAKGMVLKNDKNIYQKVIQITIF